MALADDIKKAIVTYIAEPLVTTAGSAYLAGGSATGYTATRYFDGGEEDIIVNLAPIVSIVSIENMSTSATLTATSYDFSTEFIWKTDGYTWSYGRKKWKVIYIAGYTTMPAEIARAITIWTAYLTQDSTGKLKSYKTGDDSEVYRDTEDIGGMPEVVRALLGKYKRRRF